MSKIVTETIRLDTLHLMDQRVEQMWQVLLERAKFDCMNRPGEKKARKVVIEFSLEPVMDPETRECEMVNMTMIARSHVPDHVTSTYRLGVDASRKGLVFNRDLPSEIDQTTLFPSEGTKTDE